MIGYGDVERLGRAFDQMFDNATKFTPEGSVALRVRRVDIGPRTGAFPVARVSRDSGWYLQWSPDSKRVYWTQGAELFSRELTRTFTFRP